jgi:hypothetical protein
MVVLAGEAGVRQFLDIGTGLPAAGSVPRRPWISPPSPPPPRDYATVARFFADLELVPPGVVRPDARPEPGSYGFPAPGAGAGNTITWPVGCAACGPPYSWPTT